MKRFESRMKSVVWPCLKGLEQYEGEKIMTELSFLAELSFYICIKLLQLDMHL